MSAPTVWCGWSRRPVAGCTDHAEGHPHRDVPSVLGPDDEPRSGGALVLVWAGEYRWQEVWVASGANIGNWYCLGSEFGRPKAWDAPRQDMWDRSAVSVRPTGTIPQHPHWEDVLARGPVSLLSYDNREAYAFGWRNGRRHLVEAFESLAEEDDPGAYGSAGG